MSVLRSTGTCQYTVLYAILTPIYQYIAKKHLAVILAV